MLGLNGLGAGRMKTHQPNSVCLTVDQYMNGTRHKLDSVLVFNFSTSGIAPREIGGSVIPVSHWRGNVWRTSMKACSAIETTQLHEPRVEPLVWRNGKMLPTVYNASAQPCKIFRQKSWELLRLVYNNGSRTQVL